MRRSPLIQSAEVENDPSFSKSSIDPNIDPNLTDKTQYNYQSLPQHSRRPLDSKSSAPFEAINQITHRQAKQQQQQAAVASGGNDDTVPHARMVNGKFDLSPYFRADLVDSLSKLTSIRFGLTTLCKPAAWIMWRSLCYDDAVMNLSAMIRAITTNQPIEPVQFKKRQHQTQQSLPQRRFSVATLLRRLIQFWLVGVPLAICVGLMYGVLNWIQAVLNCLIQFVRIILRIYRQVCEDVYYYKSNAAELPERRETVDAVITQVIGPYTSHVVSHKIPIVGQRIAVPIQKRLGKMASRRINALFDTIEMKTQQFKQRRERHRKV